MKTKQIERDLADKSPRQKPIPDDAYLSLGAVLLNLAVSGRLDGGIAKGQYVYLVGDSSSGKTLLVLTILAEACANKNFDGYDLIYDGPEFGNKFKIEKFWGAKLANRLQVHNSATVQEFYHQIHKQLKKRPCIYIEDSMDALLAVEDNEKFEEEIEAADAGKEISGSYGMAKAKINSNNIKRVVSMCAKSGSILILISQTRDKIGARFPTKTRAGGKALRFYADVELWTAIKNVLKHTRMGKEREYGKQITVDIQKNRICGWEGIVEVPLLRNVGVDDTGASVDFLVSEKFWSAPNGKIKAPQFGFEGKREQLIEKIESSEKRRERLAFLTQAHWLKIDEATTLKRRKRYT